MGNAEFDATVKSLQNTMNSSDFDPKVMEQKYGISPDMMPELLKFAQQFWSYING